jgi:Spy/CpxP family protein refolding chaperone
MKTILNQKRVLSIVLTAFLVTAYTFAQEPEHKGCMAHMDIPGLTDEQKSKIDELTVPHMQTMNTYMAELEKLEAELKVLEIADNPDLKLVYAKIDEISAMQNKIEKERSKHHLAIRALLTPEQKVAFDMHNGKNLEHGQSKHCAGAQEAKHCGEGHKEGSGPSCTKHAETQN